MTRAISRWDPVRPTMQSKHDMRVRPMASRIELLHDWIARWVCC